MKPKKLLTLTLLVIFTLFLTQCKKGGMFEILDDDSDRPEWAQGNKEENPHIGKVDTVEKMKGDLYGDLYQILRDDDGVPLLKLINGEYYVRPFDDQGEIPFTIGDDGDPIFARLPVEVELSRLNIIRAPDAVLDNAMKEVKLIIEGNGVIFDPGGRIIGIDTIMTIEGEDTTYTPNYTIVESPLANMTVYKEIMPTQSVGALFNLANSVEDYGSDMQLAASCLAGATNKETTMSIDQLVYFNTFAKMYGEDPFEDAVGNKFYNFNGYAHNRNRYKNRWLEVTRIVGTTVVTTNETVFQFMGWSDYNGTGKSGIQQFLDAVNDATHVLFTVHEDSYVNFIPDYTMPVP